MPTNTPRTKTFVIPNMSDRYPPLGNPPDGYVITYQASDGYYIARPPIKILSFSSPTISPYTVTVEDVVLVQTHAGTFTVNLPTGSIPGTTVFIKDFAGVAAANVINVVAAALIDGTTPYIINTNYGQVRVIYNGVTWSILSK